MRDWRRRGFVALAALLAALAASCGKSKSDREGEEAGDSGTKVSDSKTGGQAATKSDGETDPDAADKSDSKKDLTAIARGAGDYVGRFGQNRFFPRSVGDLVDKEIITEKALLVNNLDTAPPKLRNGVPCSYESAFDKYPDRVLPDSFPPRLILAWDRKVFADGKRCVVFFDTHTERLAEEEFQEQLGALDRYVKANIVPEE